MVTASQTAWIDTLPVAMAFGLAITVVAYATAHVGSGQLNPAVTFGLGLAGNLAWYGHLAFLLHQMRVGMSTLIESTSLPLFF